MFHSMDNTSSAANALRQAQLFNQKIKKERSVERRAVNGNYVAYACGPIIGRPRYINERIELELVEFKKEIEDKFARSQVN